MTHDDSGDVIAAVEFRLCSLRFLFHAHPAQFSNEPDQLVRLLS
jgi:hypothetical protein